MFVNTTGDAMEYTVKDALDDMDREREDEHAHEIDRFMAEVQKSQGNALTEISRIISNLKELMGNRLYYVELAEGHEGHDALAELETAARALRNVGRIIREVK